MKHPWISRALPFGLYMLFIALQGPIEALLDEETASVYLTPLFYALKITVVFLALLFFRKTYDELSFRGVSPGRLTFSLVAGLVVFMLWINMDWPFATLGDVKPYDPQLLPDKWLYPFIFIRILGAALIVPIFEELFWRSFILRYIINTDFTAVKIGTFTWPSFVISSILFGLEHHLWLAGIMAGIFYNLVLYRTRNLWCCIFAHGLTNLLLGIYVVKTGGWAFW